jgi:hypothetical protein
VVIKVRQYFTPNTTPKKEYYLSKSKGKKLRKLLLFIPFVLLFAFKSSYLQNYEINLHCGKLLHKRSFDICSSYKDKILLHIFL